MAKTQKGEKMFCKYCGKQIPSDSSFCRYCGVQLVKSATMQTTYQSTNNKPQTTQQHTQTTKSSAQNTHSPTQKSTTSSGTGFAKFLIFALFCFIAYIVYTNSTESENFSSGGSARQHIYIDNTYEAFAAASVGDWYIDINDGNKPKQVTQGDIDWSRQKLREQGKTLPTKKSTSTTTTASKKATVATTKAATATSTAVTNNSNNSHTFSLPASYSEAYSWRNNTPDKRMTALKNDSSAENLRRSNPESYVRRVAQEINKYAKNDFEKAKMAHDIVAITVAYDWAAFRSKNYPSQKGLDVLRRGTAVCDGYSQAYKAVCDAINLPCEKVSGYARGVSTSLANETASNVTKSNHAWNIVKIKGVWYLVDVTWDSDDYETNYLFAEPKSFLHTHFPTESRHQLLAKPLSASEFVALPNLRPNFFNAVASHNMPKITRASSGEFQTQFNLASGYDISFTVKNSNGNLISNCDFVQKNGNTATAMFSFPSSGQYTVSVFQKRNGGESNFCGEFLVNASSGSNVHFAKTFSNYGEKANGTVLSPIRSPIQRGSTQTFSVYSNKNSVAVIIDGNWTYLSRNSKGIYTGMVSIPYGASVVKVSVGDKRGETHWSLAEYEVR